MGETIVNAIDGGNITDIFSAIGSDKEMTEAQKEILLSEIQKDVEYERELTKRWELDTKSEDWLPRNVRPLVVANFTILIDFVLIASQFGRPIAEAYLPLLMTMGVTAIGGYFTVREIGKTNKNKK